ncbi:MAG: dephospho-CoA kinase [Bacteroidales bacterium]
MTLRVGITGGIGSGKSTVCSIIETLGYPVYYADLEAKKISETDADVIAAISELFGQDIYVSGKLDRKRLALRVFNDKNLLVGLNSIIHPAVAKYFNEWANRNSQNSIVFEEAAILFESGANKLLDKSILVTAPIDVRIKRVVERDGVTKDDVKQRMANQFSEEKLMELVDFVIYNDGVSLLLPQVLDVIEKLKSKSND